MHAILCFGDSITYGRGENPSKGWVGRLKQEFEKQKEYNAVYNLGIPGNSSENLLARIDKEAKSRVLYLREEDKYTIIIAIGLNDTRTDKQEEPFVTKKEFSKNITEIINQARQHTENIIVLGITPVQEQLVQPYEETYFSNNRIQEYNKILQQICAETTCEFVDTYAKLENTTYLQNLQDGLHPTTTGYDILYDILQPEIKDKL